MLDEVGAGHAVALQALFEDALAELRLEVGDRLLGVPGGDAHIVRGRVARGESLLDDVGERVPVARRIGGLPVDGRAAARAVQIPEEPVEVGRLRDLGGRKRALDGIKPILRSLRDPVVRDGYIARAAQRVGTCVDEGGHGAEIGVGAPADAAPRFQNDEVPA